MTISSRTPEGIPHRCPVCCCQAAVEPSYPGGDACCPTCGSLLWWFRNRLEAENLDDAALLASSLLHDHGFDSLDTVEFVMEFEEEFDVSVPSSELERIQTVEDAVRYVRERRVEPK